MIPVLLSAVVLSACGRHSAAPNQAMSADLKHDLDQVTDQGLDLASQQNSAAFPLTEIKPQSSPAPTRTLRKASGPKAVASKKPTVKAAPEPVVAENVDKPQAETATPAPSPTVDQAPDPAAPAVPRPSSIPVDPNGGAGASGRDGGGRSTGTSDGGSVLGGIFGVIIRGAIGDGDHCDPRTDGRGRGRGRVYNPNFPPDPGSMGTPRRIPSRFPIY